MTSTLSASASPKMTPNAAPIQPISTPCVMNTAMTPRGLKPRVRRMAMSVRLSFTTMTSVATMLNTATATMSIRISPIMVFSMRMARKYASLS